MIRSLARYTITTALLVSLPWVSGCGDTMSVAPIAGITIRNLTPDSIAVTLMEREDSYLVDPVPERAASEEGDRLVVPGGERLFDVSRVSGYEPGKDIRMFLYRIRAGRSVFVGVRDASNMSLRVSGYVVEIPASAIQ